MIVYTCTEIDILGATARQSEAGTALGSLMQRVGVELAGPSSRTVLR